MTGIVRHSKAKRKLCKHLVILQDCSRGMQYPVYQTILCNTSDVQNGTWVEKNVCWCVVSVEKGMCICSHIPRLVIIVIMDLCMESCIHNMYTL